MLYTDLAYVCFYRIINIWWRQRCFIRAGIWMNLSGRLLVRSEKCRRMKGKVPETIANDTSHRGAWGMKITVLIFKTQECCCSIWQSNLEHWNEPRQPSNTLNMHYVGFKYHHLVFKALTLRKDILICLSYLFLYSLFEGGRYPGDSVRGQGKRCLFFFLH